MDERTAVLVGAEFEENLSTRYLASAARLAGFQVILTPFNNGDEQPTVVRDILSVKPMVVGISTPFQTRAKEFLSLSEQLRRSGYDGHITLGGHFPTLEYLSIMRDCPAVDSVVRHEGEETFCELCRRLRRGDSIDNIPGLVTRKQAEIVVGSKRPLPKLDSLEFPDRAGKDPHRVLGVPCAPIIGSRGCYANCAFCCINAYSRNADGPRFRRRSPENIVQEMAQEYHQRGVRLFVFHDDNFFVPNQPSNMIRYRELADCLAQAGLTDIGLVIKCRPSDVDPELFSVLKRMGLIRVYVGIESNSSEGLISLNRGVSQEDNRRAIHILNDLGIYHSFNLLIFDPEATLNGIRANLAFMEEFAESPSNFCRAEVYAGTPLKEILERQGRLVGNYLAWNYAMRDSRVEMLFRIASTAFASRNFKCDGAANLNMGIRFDAEVMRRFYPESFPCELDADLKSLSKAISQDSVDQMRRAVEFVSTEDFLDDGLVRGFTIGLARQIATRDLEFVSAIKTKKRLMERVTGTSFTSKPTFADTAVGASGLGA